MAGATKQLAISDGVTITDATPVEYLELTEQGSEPSTPGTGKKRYWPSTDGKTYSKDDAGNKLEVIEAEGILDEDDMASDSDSHLATQQSIKAYIDAQIALVSVAVPTGVEMFWLSATAPSGWLIEGSGTIGNASSGATARANADTEDLFTFLWNNQSNTLLPIEDSTGTPTTRGADAATDFAANKRLPLPDPSDRFFKAKSSGTNLGENGGNSTHTHTITHTHTVTHDHGNGTLRAAIAPFNSEILYNLSGDSFSVTHSKPVSGSVVGDSGNSARSCDVIGNTSSENPTTSAASNANSGSTDNEPLSQVRNVIIKL